MYTQINPCWYFYISGWKDDIIEGRNIIEIDLTMMNTNINSNDAKNIISLVRKFDTLPRFSFESATCPYKTFIHLSI